MWLSTVEAVQRFRRTWNIHPANHGGYENHRVFFRKLQLLTGKRLTNGRHRDANTVAAKRYRMCYRFAVDH